MYVCINGWMYGINNEGKGERERGKERRREESEGRKEGRERSVRRKRHSLPLSLPGEVEGRGWLMVLVYGF